MEELIKISSRVEYDKWQNDREPLIDPAFDIDINVRKEVQDELFGSEGSDPANRRKFFLWVWDRKPHTCEETGTFLGTAMQPEYMSHILSRGAHIEMWNDPRNINILSPDSHRQWETGKREKMIIWKKNKPLIALLKADYSKFKRYKQAEPDMRSKSQILRSAIFKYWEMNNTSGKSFDEFYNEKMNNFITQVMHEIGQMEVDRLDDTFK